MKKRFIKSVLVGVLLAMTISCSKEDSAANGSSGNSTEIAIGNQLWMKKNLSVDHYRNGDPIPRVDDPTEWANLTTGAWCYYAGLDENEEVIYGKLYNWYAVNDPRGLAPEGYHIPSYDEWLVLINALGGDLVAGVKLKEATLWNDSGKVGTMGTNSSKFEAFPGGIRNDNGNFAALGSYGFWWSTTTSLNDANYANDVYLAYNFKGVTLDEEAKKYFGMSVRCLKD